MTPRVSLELSDEQWEIIRLEVHLSAKRSPLRTDLLDKIANARDDAMTWGVERAEFEGEEIAVLENLGLLWLDELMEEAQA